MMRIPKAFPGATALVLLLAACVPLDGEGAAGGPPAPSPVPTHHEVPPTASVLMFQPYESEGLAKRISGLPPAMAAHQVRRGMHPVVDAEPGSERVQLAEHFSTSTRFALPGDGPGRGFHIELSCSTPVAYAFRLLDGDSAELAGDGGTQCGPGGPVGISGSVATPREAAFLEVTFRGDTEADLAYMAFVPVDGT
ncbi:hypothetical protein KRR55_11780 [Paeniglutamicibacter sp. ABSL32-1]|uniref:hypothetical protein n=1 Tax=Paeniglutamicibacter quisquiliarum TaxID=2849498 RepID=UPI001C2DBDFA|nr:hypothetical protein [Paeniglutamicibacter quisquiliarum]MBV1779791.1 hypothetical protein [Paeniglutamicibacter quisquiliarum]